MYESLGRSQLKSGEWMDIGVVHAPDSEWASILPSFLAHKGDDWLPQIVGALNGPLEGLETRFYVGRVDGQLACQTMIVGDRGVGIVSHVYTRPEDRRKGAIAALLNVAMPDTGKSFHTLTLGTEFDCPAYWIYHKLGFRSVAPRHGEMQWTMPSDSDQLFAPGPATVRPVRWEDWGFFNRLALSPVSDCDSLPRSRAMMLKGQGSVEWGFLILQALRDREPRVQTLSLVGDRGATVGWAILSPDPSWQGDVWQLDLYAHPNYAESLPRLLSALDLPAETVVSYTTQPSGTQAEALRAAGFRDMALLPKWLNYDGRRDLLMMAHGPAG